MKKILLILLFLLSNCGYQPLYSNKNINEFVFKEIEIRGDKNINRSLISSTFIKKDTQNYVYDKIILENNKSIVETSKDSKGRVATLKKNVEVKLIILNGDKIIKEKISNNISR